MSSSPGAADPAVATSGTHASAPRAPDRGLDKHRDLNNPDAASGRQPQLSDRTPATTSSSSSNVSMAARDTVLNSEYDIATQSRGNAYRLADDRPPPDVASLTSAGLRLFQSTHLQLLTDVGAADADDLPSLADALFETLERETGPLAPAPDGSTFQVTGSLIDARERFEHAGMMPGPEFTIRHGRHLGYRFWVFNPSADYYRRHLVLHEFVHCFMMCEHGMQNIPPLWFTEGIAEFWATHALEESSELTSAPNSTPSPGRVRFGILPATVEEFSGWARIAEIQRSFRLDPITGPDFGPLRTEAAVASPVDAAGRSPELPTTFAEFDAGFVSLDEVLHPPTSRFTEDSQYAHAWALCWFLSSHPDYRETFADIRRIRQGDEFRLQFQQRLAPRLPEMAIDWLLTLDSLIEGFDVERSFARRSLSPALPFDEAATLAPANADDQSASGQSSLRQHEVAIDADRDWQSAGIQLAEGTVVRVLATGQFRLTDDTPPWFSEPQGVTKSWHRGRPDGELVGLLVSPAGDHASRRIALGAAAEFHVPFAAELWLQLNESAAHRADNTGRVRVMISQVR